MPEIDTKKRLKEIALKLFAAEGIDTVSVRDILGAAGHKNGGALHYHFGGKEALVQALAADGAQRIDAWRSKLLDALEAEGGPHSLREVIQILVHSPGLDCAEDARYILFMNSLLVKHHALLLEGFEGHDAGFRRCVSHLRHRLPRLAPELFEQRLRLVMLYIFSAMAAREQLGGGGTWNRLWQHPASNENFVDTIEGMLLAPVSAATQATLDTRAPSGSRRA